MPTEPTYEELAKRVAALEEQVERNKAVERTFPPDIVPILMEAFRYIPVCKTFEDAAKKIFEQCKRLTGARSGYVALLSEDGEENEVLFLDAGGMPCDVDPDLPMPIRGLREVAYRTQAVAYDNDFAESPWMAFMPEGHVRLDNVLFAPLNIEGKTVGIIGIANKPGGFDEQDVHISRMLGELAAVALTYAKAEDSLRESETKYRQLVSNLPGTAYRFVRTPKGDFHFEFIGEKCIELFGVSAAEILADANLVFDSIPQPDADTVHQAIMNSAASLAPYDVEHRVIKKNGDIVWMHASSIPRKMGDGSIVWDGIGLNITEKRQTDEALRESQGNLISLIDNTDDIIVSRDREGRAIVFNNPFRQIVKAVFGVEAAPGIRTTEFLPEEQKNHWEEVLSTVLERGVRQREEFTWNIGGKTHYFEISHSPIRVEGKIVGTTEFTRDITERKKAEDSLRESEFKYRQLTETMLETLSVIDLDGVFLYANRNASHNLSGGESDDIAGKDIRQFLPKDQAEQLIAQYKTVYSSNEPHSQEILVQLQKGDRWFSNTLKPIDFGPSQVPAVLSVALDITERKNAEVSLHESETKYRVLFNTFPLGITISDESGNIVEANDISSELLGISKNEHQERRIDGPEWRIIRPDGSDMPQEEWASVRALKERRLCKNAEMGIVKPDGKTKWINVTAAPLLLERYGVVVAYGDITGHKQTEQNYQTLFREMIDGFALHEIICDKDGQPENYMFLAVNPAFEKMTGLTADKIVGRNVLEVIPDLEPYWIETYGNVALSGEPAYFENYSAAIGKHFQVTAFRPLPGQFACIFTDITERKAAENELRESEEKFRNFTEQSFVGFYILQDGLFTYVNPKFADIFGYTIDECLNGMHFRQLVHTEDLARVEEQVRRRVAGEIDAVQYTFRGVKKSGEVIHVSIYGSSLTYQGRPAAIGTMLDITKDLEMEKRLAQSQRMEAIGSLAGGIAHDFNNILFPIVGMSELFLEDFPPDSPEHENAQEIFKAGKRGSDLVKQILAFSRQSEIKKIPIRIQQILKEVVKLSRSTIPADIDIIQDIQSNCSMVQADPTQVHQIAMNLITNAFHAVESKSGEIAVRLREVEIESGRPLDSDLLPGRYALLSVSDTGIGIDPAMLQKIFDPYFTTKEQGKGTGLGLAVVYGIVKEHQGDIKVISELEKGTTFNVYLPIMAPTEKSFPAEKKDDDPKGHERILLVDDEASIAKLEKQMLERLGYTVTMRVNSLEALEAFKAKPESFDLVISDMSMPQMTGDRLAEALLAIRSDIPMIICTGFSEKMDAKKAKEMGIKGFLMKPVVKSEMAKTVRKVLDDRVSLL